MDRIAPGGESSPEPLHPGHRGCNFGLRQHIAELNSAGILVKGLAQSLYHCPGGTTIVGTVEGGIAENGRLLQAVLQAICWLVQFK
jgi:hypothetical protein